MRIFLVLAGLAFSLAAQPQEIYRWVDKDGIVHYADQPDSPDAKLITVIEPNAYEAEDAAQASASGGEEDEPAEEPLYSALTIVQPAQDQVFFGADATVTLAATVRGTLRGDHSLVFYLNGERQPAAGGNSLRLPNLPRGTYYARAAVLDSFGEQLIASQQTTFHVRQPSINSPQSPQARRPAQPPRPTPRPATN